MYKYVLYIVFDKNVYFTCLYIPFYYRGLCPSTYPDEVCRDNFGTHYYDPPLLYDLNSDPGEIYELSVTEHADVMATINKVINF